MTDRYLWHSTPLKHPGQALEVEYVRDADWDRRWAVVFQGIRCRQEVRRLATFTEAQAMIARHLARAAERDTA
jgi:hypothetical protein